MVCLRWSRGFVIVLSLVLGALVTSPGTGQCPSHVPGCGVACCGGGATPLSLDLGEIEPGIFTISVTGQPSTWFWIHARAFLDTPTTPEDEPLLQYLIATYPWLAKDCWTTSAVVDFFDVDPDLLVSNGGQSLTQANLFQSHPIVASYWNRAVKLGQPELVRPYYQPIPLGGARNWVINCQTWSENIAPVWQYAPISIWRPRLATNADGPYTNNYDKYTAERIAQAAILEQAPCVSKAKQFLNSYFGHAVGAQMVKITLSAVGVIDQSGAFPSGLLDSQVPALPSLPEPPRLRVSPGSPMTVPIRSAALSWGPWNGAFLSPSASYAYAFIVVPMRGMSPPLSMHASVNGQTWRITGEFHSVGRARFPLDPSWTPGTQIQILDVSNRFGVTQEAWPPITVEP